MTDLTQLYNQCYKSVKAELCKCGCNSTNFEDIYQEAFYDLWRKQMAGDERDFLQGYVIKMCKYSWYRQKKKQRLLMEIDDMLIYVEEEVENNEKIGFMMKHFKNLSPSCKEILSLFVKGLSEKELGDRLNLPNRDAVKNKKFNCKSKLRDMMSDDPLYEKLYGGKI